MKLFQPLFAAALLAGAAVGMSAQSARADDNGTVTASVSAAAVLGLEVKLVATPTTTNVGRIVVFFATVRNISGSPIGPVQVEIQLPSALFDPPFNGGTVTFATVKPRAFGRRTATFVARARAPGNAIGVANASSANASVTSNTVLITVRDAGGGGPVVPPPPSEPGIQIWILLPRPVVPNFTAPPIIYFGP